MLSKSIIQDTRMYSFTSTFLDKLIGVGSINWPMLALTRFLLSFVVVSAHIVPHVPNSGPLKWINNFNAFNAIMGFLLISGLSIGSSIAKNKEGYFSRRIQRIYPVYLASIVLQYLIVPQELTLIFILFIIVNLFFANQVIIPASYVGPAWTLSLEVWLYGLAPVFLKQSYKTLLTLVTISFVCYCFYTAGRSLFHWPYYSGTNFGINLLLLSFIWLIGFMLAIFSDKRKEISIIISLLFIIHFVLTVLIAFGSRVKHQEINLFFTTDISKYIFELICLIFIYFIVVGTRSLPQLSLLYKRFFNFLGNISYPLYLTHFSVLILCKKLQIGNWFLLVICCLAVATAVYWIFDFYSKKRSV
ncbi:acyltransferase family protein [Spirosoma areae]